MFHCLHFRISLLSEVQRNATDQYSYLSFTFTPVPSFVCDQYSLGSTFATVSNVFLCSYMDSITWIKDLI